MYLSQIVENVLYFFLLFRKRKSTSKKSFSNTRNFYSDKPISSQLMSPNRPIYY